MFIGSVSSKRENQIEFSIKDNLNTSENYFGNNPYVRDSIYFPNFSESFANAPSTEEYYIFSIVSGKTGDYLITDCTEVSDDLRVNKSLLLFFAK